MGTLDTAIAAVGHGAATLTERTVAAASTQRLAALIALVTSGTARAVDAMRQGVGEVERWGSAADEARSSLSRISDSVGATREVMGRIVNAMNGLRQSNAEIASDVNGVAAIT